MKLLELDANSYLQNVSSAFSLFDTVPFAELNRHKVDRVHYLLFADERKKFALIGGEKNGVGQQHVHFGQGAERIFTHGQHLRQVIFTAWISIL